MSQALRVADGEALHEMFCQQLAQAIDTTSGRFAWALSGGSTPESLFKHLAKYYRTAIEWSRVHFFWGDERCVAADHPDSNYRMARAALLDPLEIPPENVHRIAGELTPPARAAASYEQHLRTFFATTTPPAFDLVLLGMGEDGHTASLFPGASALQERQRWAIEAHTVTAHPPWRVTLTLPLLNGAQRAWFLVTGSKKQRLVEAIFTQPEDAFRRYPAAQVRTATLQPVWFLDSAARGGWQKNQV